MLVDNYCLCFMFNMRQRKTMHFVFWNKYCLSPLLLWLITRTLISFLLKSKSLSPGVYSYIYFNFTRGNSNPCYSNLTHYLQSTFRFLSSHFLYNFTLDNSNHVCVTSNNKQCIVVQNIKCAGFEAVVWTFLLSLQSLISLVFTQCCYLTPFAKLVLINFLAPLSAVCMTLAFIPLATVNCLARQHYSKVILFKVT